MALATSTVNMISRNLSLSARTLTTACAARPAPLPSTTATPAADAAGGAPVRRSVSCSQVTSPLRRLSTLPALRAESVTLIQKRRSSNKPHDAGCPCPSPCGPSGCPKGCGCLPPPCNVPPKCIQHMTGYYYYPYGTWFAGPYHVQGICQPIGKDSLSCDGKAAPPPCPPKDCKESSNSLLDYCKAIKKQCTPAKADCPKPPNPCSTPKQQPPCAPKKPPACPPKPLCPPTKPPGPSKTCQARPAVPLTCYRTSKPGVCSPPKPTVNCTTLKQKVICPSPKAKSLSEICKSTKKPVPPSPPRPSSPSARAKSAQSISSTRTKLTQSCPPKPNCPPPVTKLNSPTGICSSRQLPAVCPPKVRYQPTPPKNDKMPKSIFDFYLKSLQKPDAKPNRV